LLENLVFILIFILAGYALRRSGVIDENGGRALVSVTIWLFLPALILRSLWGTTSQEILGALVPLVAVMLATVTVLMIWWWLSPRISEEPKRAGIITLAAAFGNTGFLGFPVVLLLLGEGALRIAVLYSLSWNILFWTLGVGVAARFAGRAASPRQMLSGLTSHPPTWAILVGLAMLFFGIYPPEQVAGFFDLLADATVPVIMISLGTFMSFRIDRGYLRPFVAVCAGKFMALPALSLAACLLVGASDIQTATFVLQAAMPPAILLGMVATRFGLDEEYNSNMTFAATVIGIIGIAVGAVLAGVGGVT